MNKQPDLFYHFYPIVLIAAGVGPLIAFAQTCKQCQLDARSDDPLVHSVRSVI